MTKTTMSWKLALMATGCVFAAGLANAQTSGGYVDQPLAIGNPSGYSFSSGSSIRDIPGLGMRFQRHGDHQMWNTVLVVSAVLFFVGIADNDAGLAILGGAGVVVSLIETNQMGFHMNLVDRGVNFASAGPVSFGFQPMAPATGGFRTAFDQPGLYLKAGFRF